MSDRELVSVIIPTIGRLSIRGVLAALARQVDPGPFEVITVTDGGPPFDVAGVSTHPDCERFVATAVPVRSGVSVARNLGADEAEGKVLGFLDDDTIPAPDWVATARTALRDGRARAVVGRIREMSVDPLGRLRALAYDHRHGQNSSSAFGAEIARRFGLAGRDCLPVDYLSGGNCCVAAADFRAVGGFDPAYLVGQDRELALRLLAAGSLVAYVPGLVIEHHTDGTVLGMLRGRFRSGRSAATMSQAPVPRALVRSTYGGGAFAIARAAGPTAALLSWLSALAYRAGYSRRTS